MLERQECGPHGVFTYFISSAYQCKRVNCVVWIIFITEHQFSSLKPKIRSFLVLLMYFLFFRVFHHIFVINYFMVGRCISLCDTFCLCCMNWWMSVFFTLWRWTDLLCAGGVLSRLGREELGRLHSGVTGRWPAGRRRRRGQGRAHLSHQTRAGPRQDGTRGLSRVVPRPPDGRDHLRLLQSGWRLHQQQGLRLHHREPQWPVNELRLRGEGGRCGLNVAHLDWHVAWTSLTLNTYCF